MKKMINSFKFAFAIALILLAMWNCKNTTSNSKSTKKVVQTQTNAKLTVYYFHATRRCATCNAVESVAKKALKEYYGDKVSFASINREKEKDNPLIKQYKISGQTLIIIKGDKAVNLTNYAFMNARTNPEKLKAKIKTTIDSMI